MQRPAIILLFAFITGMLYGQHNYIFNGNGGSGFGNGVAQTACNNGIFGGNADDGWDAGNGSTIDQSEIYGGGTDDGFDARSTDTKVNNKVYAGGHDDGFDTNGTGTEINNTVYTGGQDDGFSAHESASETNAEIYAGGSDDGFGQAGISGTIWTGSVSKDWLIADNWLNGVVPTLAHHATIPRAVPRFPVLHGLMRVGEPGIHLYTARGVWIQHGAAIFGLDQSKIINLGVFRVSGLLDLR